MSETETVDIMVGEIEPCRGTGSLVAQAHVVLGISGIDVQLFGVQVRRRPDNRLYVQAPRYRHWRSGLWLPSVVMDRSITAAIAEEILSAMEETAA
jgi:hypothetical protein